MRLMINLHRNSRYIHITWHCAGLHATVCHSARPRLVRFTNRGICQDISMQELCMFTTTTWHGTNWWFTTLNGVMTWHQTIGTQAMLLCNVETRARIFTLKIIAQKQSIWSLTNYARSLTNARLLDCRRCDLRRRYIEIRTIGRIDRICTINGIIRFTRYFRYKCNEHREFWIRVMILFMILNLPFFYQHEDYSVSKCLLLFFDCQSLATSLT